MEELAVRSRSHYRNLIYEQEDLVDTGQEEFAEPIFDKSDFGGDWKM